MRRSEGRTSMPDTQRSSVRPVSMIGCHHWSWPSALCVQGSEAITRSGWRSKRSARCQTSPSGQSAGGGRSAGLPRGAPASTQRATVSISASLSEMSFSNCWMPTVLSRCQGGIDRSTTLVRMARAQGRTSS